MLILNRSKLRTSFVTSHGAHLMIPRSSHQRASSSARTELVGCPRSQVSLSFLRALGLQTSEAYLDVFHKREIKE